MYSPIPELNLLRAFADEIGDFSDGFEFHEYGEEAGLDTWSPDPEFVSRFVPFAYATGSGSHYALWRRDDRTDLATLPVVFVGDEGDLYIVARTVVEFFQLLAIDSEFLDPRAVEEHSEAHEDYLVWLNENFGLGPPEDVRALELEREELADRFRAWAKPFVDLD